MFLKHSAQLDHVQNYLFCCLEQKAAGMAKSLHSDLVLSRNCLTFINNSYAGCLRENASSTVLNVMFKFARLHVSSNFIKASVKLTLILIYISPSSRYSKLCKHQIICRFSLSCAVQAESDLKVERSPNLIKYRLTLHKMKFFYCWPV